MNITGNVYNQPYNAPKLSFKGPDEVKFLKETLRGNRSAVSDIEQLTYANCFKKLTKDEFLLPQVQEAFAFAKKEHKRIADSIQRTWDYLDKNCQKSSH